MILLIRRVYPAQILTDLHMQVTKMHDEVYIMS